MAPRLVHQGGGGCLRWPSDFPRAGRSEICGSGPASTAAGSGQGHQLPDVLPSLAYSPLGRAVVTYWSLRPGCGVCNPARRSWPWSVERVLLPQGRGVMASPRDDLPKGTGGSWGCSYVLDVPGGTTVQLALGPGLDQSGISGVRPPPQTQAAAWAAADHGAAR